MEQDKIYAGRPCDWGVTKSKAGNFMVFVEFEYESDHGRLDKKKKYYSFTSDKAARFSLRELQVCGLKGDDVSILAEGPAGRGLNETNIVELVIGPQRSQDGTKTYYNIKFVNRMGRGPTDKVEVGEAAAFFKQFKAVSAELRSKGGAAPANEDIPF